MCLRVVLASAVNCYQRIMTGADLRRGVYCLKAAAERGEISKDYPRGGLSEDGLYNVLHRLQDVLGQMALIVHHVEQSDKGSRA